jgi:hypothetical protein
VPLLFSEAFLEEITAAKASRRYSVPIAPSKGWACKSQPNQSMSFLAPDMFEAIKTDDVAKTT